MFINDYLHSWFVYVSHYGFRTKADHYKISKFYLGSLSFLLCSPNQFLFLHATIMYLTSASPSKKALFHAYRNALSIVCTSFISSGTNNWELITTALMSLFILVTLPTQTFWNNLHYLLFSLGTVEINIILCLSLDNSCGFLNIISWYEIV